MHFKAKCLLSSQVWHNCSHTTKNRKIVFLADIKLFLYSCKELGLTERHATPRAGLTRWTDRVTDSVTDKVTERVTDKVTDSVTDRVTKRLTDRVTE